MSDWMIDPTEHGEMLRFWNGDLGYEVQVIHLTRTDGYQFNIEWYEDEGMRQIERRSADAFAHGRNLEILRDFIMGPAKDNLIAHVNRLQNLLRSIKYQAKGFDGLECENIAQRICDAIPDEEIGWI